MQLILTHNLNGQEVVERYPKTKKGNSDLNKRVAAIYTAYKENNWFIYLDEILKLRAKVDSYPTWKSRTKKTELEDKLKALEAERADTIQLLSIPEAAPLKLTITHE